MEGVDKVFGEQVSPNCNPNALHSCHCNHRYVPPCTNICSLRSNTPTHTSTNTSTNTVISFTTNKILCSILGQQVTILLDTGAQISGISLAFYNTLSTDNYLARSTSALQSCKMANKTIAKIECSVTLPIIISGVEFSVLCHVIHGLDFPLVLGLPFFNNHCISLNFRSQTLILSNKTENTRIQPPILEQQLHSISPLCKGTIIAIQTPRGSYSVPPPPLRSRRAYNHVVDPLKEVIDRADLSSSLISAHQKNTLRKIFRRNIDALVHNDDDLGCYKHYVHTIQLEPNAKLPQAKPYKVPPHLQKPFKAELDRMVSRGLIKPTYSHCSIPCFVVKKQAPGAFRMVCDMRAINKFILAPPILQYTLDDLIQQLSGITPRYLTSLDLKDAFYQVRLSPESQKICSVNTSYGIFSYQRLIQGAKDSPFVLSSVLQKVLSDLPQVYYYADDILIISDTWESHVETIDEVLSRFADCGLKISAAKSKFATDHLKFLGLIFEPGRIRPDVAQLTKVVSFPVPKTYKDLRSFLGLTNFLRRFIHGYAAKAAPLQNIIKDTKAMNTRLPWTPENNEVFVALKMALAQAPYLTFADFTLDTPLILATDSSDIAIGYSLSQMQPTEHSKKYMRQYIFFSGNILKDAQKRYPIYKRELLAILVGLRRLHSFLTVRPFVIHCDSSSVVAMLSKIPKQRIPDQTLDRWINHVTKYQYTIKHVRSTEETMYIADYISRYGNAAKMPPFPDIEKHIDSRLYALLAAFASDTKQPGENNGASPLHSMTANQRAVQRSATSRQSPSDHNAHLFSDSAQPLKHVHSAKNNRLLPYNHITLEKIASAQNSDPKFYAMKQFLLNDTIPDDSATYRFVSTRSTEFTLDDACVLYRIAKLSAKTPTLLQICVPSSYVYTIMYYFHDIPLYAHEGVTRMYYAIRQRFYWPNMFSDINTYVNTCETCAVTSRASDKVPMVHRERATEPFQNLFMDLLHIPTPSMSKNYILCIVDEFSGHVTLVALKNKTARAVAMAVFTRHILVYGLFANCWLTDNGTEFVNHFSEALFKLLQVKTLQTSVYQPRGNLTERKNTEIIRYLRKYCHTKPKTWATELGKCQLALNSMVCSRTQLSPLQKLYGKACISPLDIVLPDKFSPNFTSNEQSFDYWKDQLTRLRRIASERSDTSRFTDISRRNVNKKWPTFKVGDIVYLRDFKRKDRKLLPFFNKTKYRIYHMPNKTTVRLQSLNGHKLRYAYHINKLRHVRQRQTFAQPSKSSKTMPKTIDDSAPSASISQRARGKQIATPSGGQVNHTGATSAKRSDNGTARSTGLPKDTALQSTASRSKLTKITPPRKRNTANQPKPRKLRSTAPNYQRKHYSHYQPPSFQPIMYNISAMPPKSVVLANHLHPLAFEAHDPHVTEISCFFGRKIPCSSIFLIWRYFLSQLFCDGHIDKLDSFLSVIRYITTPPHRLPRSCVLTAIDFILDKAMRIRYYTTETLRNELAKTGNSDIKNRIPVPKPYISKLLNIRHDLFLYTDSHHCFAHCHSPAANLYISCPTSETMFPARNPFCATPTDIHTYFTEQQLHTVTRIVGFERSLARGYAPYLVND